MVLRLIYLNDRKIKFSLVQIYIILNAWFCEENNYEYRLRYTTNKMVVTTKNVRDILRSYSAIRCWEFLCWMYRWPFRGNLGRDLVNAVLSLMLQCKNSTFLHAKHSIGIITTRVEISPRCVRYFRVFFISHTHIQILTCIFCLYLYSIE